MPPAFWSRIQPREFIGMIWKLLFELPTPLFKWCQNFICFLLLIFFKDLSIFLTIYTCFEVHHAPCNKLFNRLLHGSVQFFVEIVWRRVGTVLMSSYFVWDWLFKISDFIDGRFCINFIKFQYWMFLFATIAMMMTMVLFVFVIVCSILLIERTLIVNT